MHILILILVLPEFLCTTEDHYSYSGENHKNSEMTTTITEIRGHNNYVNRILTIIDQLSTPRKQI